MDRDSCTKELGPMYNHVQFRKQSRIPVQWAKDSTWRATLHQPSNIPLPSLCCSGTSGIPPSLPYFYLKFNTDFLQESLAVFFFSFFGPIINAPLQYFYGGGIMIKCVI